MGNDPSAAAGVMLAMIQRCGGVRFEAKQRKMYWWWLVDDFINYFPQGVRSSIAEYEFWLAKRQSEGTLPGAFGAGAARGGLGQRLRGGSRMGAAEEGGGLLKFEDLDDASDGSGTDDEGMDYGGGSWYNGNGTEDKGMEYGV